MNIKEIIRAEIGRLRDEYTDIAINSHYGTVNANYVVDDLEQLLSFLDSLPEQHVSDHHEIEVEFRGEKVTISREFYRDGERNYSTGEQDDNAIWSALRAWCEKKGITPFELYPKQSEQPVEWKDEYREEDLRTRFAFYTYKNEEDDGVLYLSNVFVEEASRNVGFGTKILEAAEKVAETIGAITIRLKVKQDSPANAWYRKRGYGYIAFEGEYDWLEKNLEYLKPKRNEQPVEGLEEAAEKSASQYYVDGGYSPFPNVETAAHEAGFIAGAEWMKNKMMEEAVEGEIQMRYSGCLCAKTIRAINEDKFKLGDKVRVIVIKED